MSEEKLLSWIKIYLISNYIFINIDDVLKMKITSIYKKKLKIYIKSFLAQFKR
jgi:hypothetical protein